MAAALTRSRKRYGIHTERAIYRLLHHTGVLPLNERWSGTLESRWVTGAQEGMIYAPCEGVLLAMHEPGADVRSGELAGLIYTPGIPSQAPVELRYTVDSIAVAGARLCDGSRTTP